VAIVSRNFAGTASPWLPLLLAVLYTWPACRVLRALHPEWRISRTPLPAAAARCSFAHALRARVQRTMTNTLRKLYSDDAAAVIPWLSSGRAYRSGDNHLDRHFFGVSTRRRPRRRAATFFSLRR